MYIKNFKHEIHHFLRDKKAEFYKCQKHFTKSKTVKTLKNQNTNLSEIFFFFIFYITVSVIHLRDWKVSSFHTKFYQEFSQ
jgi:hypothetical protein